MIRAHRIAETSAFLGQTCALCKQEFVTGDEIVVCPEDGSRHHTGCWRANGDKCTAYGCTGSGAISTGAHNAMERPLGRPERERPSGRPRVVTQEPSRSRARPEAARPIPNAPGSKVRTLPAGSVSCAQTCLLVAIAIAIVLFAVGCFGLWAIADYLMIQVGDMPYRAPLSEGLVSLPSLLFSIFH